MGHSPPPLPFSLERMSTRLATRQQLDLSRLFATPVSSGFFYYDRNYEAKVRLLKQQGYLPQVAMGVRDMVGTGVFG